MNNREFIPNIKPGDLITAEILNELLSRKQQPLTIRGSGGIDVRSSDGQIQLSARKASVLLKGKVATGGITARSSDAAHGSGKVDVWTKNTSTNQYSSAGFQISVDYISSTTGGLAAGVWVNCVRRDDGGYEIVSVDCSN
jgi:hypothetical protein